MPKPHASVTASRATTTLTTSSRPAMHLPVSHPPVSPQATATTSVAATAPVVAVAREALVAGATGLVGRAVLAHLLADKQYSAVHCVGRRAPSQQDPKLRVHLTDSFGEFPVPAVDDVFIALGTTLKVAGSQQAFRALDLEAVVALARAARTAGATRLGVISAMGADRQSRVFYNRVKGEMEEAVCALGFDTVVIARPSLLTGDRASLNQPLRSGEQWALRAFKWLIPLIPANYRPVDAGQVACALVDTLQTTSAGCHVLLSGKLRAHRKNLQE